MSSANKPGLGAAPYIPVDYLAADAAAIQALMIGEAEPEQQKRALAFIINNIAGTYQFNYYPSERDTAFALGRTFVGQQIVKLTKVNVSTLRSDENG